MIGLLAQGKKLFPWLRGPATGPFADRQRRRSTLVGDTDYVVFDTELTGLSPGKDSIVSIGAVKMSGGRIQLGDYFSRMVEPRTELTGRSVVIHEITPTEASACPGIEAVLPEFLDFCRDRVLVGHFVSMDLRFLNEELERLYGRKMDNPAVDTGKLYAWLTAREGGHCAFHGGECGDMDLFSLAKKYRIPVRKAHDALDDAYVTAQLFQRFLRALPEHGVKTIDDLLRAGRP